MQVIVALQAELVKWTIEKYNLYPFLLEDKQLIS